MSSAAHACLENVIVLPRCCGASGQAEDRVPVTAPENRAPGAPGVPGRTRCRKLPLCRHRGARWVWGVAGRAAMAGKTSRGRAGGSAGDSGSRGPRWRSQLARALFMTRYLGRRALPQRCRKGSRAFSCYPSGGCGADPPLVPTVGRRSGPVGSPPWAAGRQARRPGGAPLPVTRKRLARASTSRAGGCRTAIAGRAGVALVQGTAKWRSFLSLRGHRGRAGGPAQWEDGTGGRAPLSRSRSREQGMPIADARRTSA